MKVNARRVRVSSSVLHFQSASSGTPSARTDGSLMECTRKSAPARELAALPDDAIRDFLGACIAAGVLLKFTVDTEDGPRPRYRPNWEHPFCRSAIADIVTTEEGSAPAAAEEHDAPALVPVAATGT